MIKKYISEFWQWALETTNKTKEEYCLNGFDQNLGEFEDEFFKFYEMIDWAKNAVNENILDEEILFDLLNVVGFDNESYTVIDYVIEHSSDEQLKRLIEIGTNHSQMNVRWQIMQVLFEKKPEGYFEKIKSLTHDKASYVRQHARNYLNYIRFGDRWEKHLFNLLRQEKFKKCVPSKILPEPICEFCMHKIGSEKLSVGYVGDNCEFWVCETCFDDCRNGFELQFLGDMNL